MKNLNEKSGKTDRDKVNLWLDHIKEFGIFSQPDKPARDCPGYDHWLATQVWEKARIHFAEKCGPICAAEILEAAGIACCEQNENGGPGWTGVV